MTDKKHPDEEYQYPSEEVNPEVSSQQTEHIEEPQQTVSSRQKVEILLDKLKALPFLRNKRVVIVIIAVVVFFLLIKLFGGHSETIQPVSQKTTQASAQTLQQEHMNGQVRNLASQVLKNRKTLSQMQNNMKQLQSSIQDTNNVIAQLSNSITSLEHKVTTLQATPKAKTGATKLQTYYIKAVVPGRAWLTNPDNDQVVSVHVGDKLATYGVIRDIDSNSGLIMTSSGRPIRFGRDDS